LKHSVPRAYPFEILCNPTPEGFGILLEPFVCLLVIPNPGVLSVFRSGSIIFGMLYQFDIKVISHVYTNSTLLIMRMRLNKFAVADFLCIEFFVDRLPINPDLCLISYRPVNLYLSGSDPVPTIADAVMF